MDKLNGFSLDLEQTNKDKLKSVFPECFSEGTLDIDKLLSLCGEYIDNDFEKYKFEWKGKAESLKLAQKRSTGTLRPCREESVNFDETENLYIEGDNLEVLKLLQTAYYNKVKMIYIDPPYNTGNDFVYEDDFKDPLARYKEVTSQTTKSNPETMGRYHTNWLNMMYPRLRLASNLLTDDGVIFISIDDKEVFNLKKVCDEVFGEENFINLVAIDMKNVAGASGGGEDKKLKKNIETMLIYAKNYDYFLQFKNAFEFTELASLIESYKNQGKSWKYTSVLLNEGTKEFIGETFDGSGNSIKVYKRINVDIKSVSQVAKIDGISEYEVYKKYGTKIFRTTNAQSSIRTRIIKFKQDIKESEPILSIEYEPTSGKNKGVLYEQFYKDDICNLFVWLKDTSEEIDGILYKKDLIGTYWNYTGDMKNLTKEGEIPFPNGKKPLALIKRLVDMQTNQTDLILDFFSGSATTAHAVMQLNAEDGGNRKFICVQIPELTDEKSEASKAGYKNICEIGKERIRRAGAKIVQNNTENLVGTELASVQHIDNTENSVNTGTGLASSLHNIDTGFKVFKLDTSNLAEWDNSPILDEDLSMFTQRLNNMVDSIKVNRTDFDVIYEIMLKMGVPLSIPVTYTEINSKIVYVVGDLLLLICLCENIVAEDIEAMTELAPSKIICAEKSFKNDSDLSNAHYILQNKEIEMKLI